MSLPAGSGTRVKPCPRPNLRNIVNYRIISHNIAQYRTIPRTRQPRATCGANVRLLTPPTKTAALRLWERLRERLISLESCDARAQFWARTMNLWGVAKGADARKIGQNRQISPDIARYRVMSHIIAKYRGDDIVKGYGEGRDTTPDRASPRGDTPRVSSTDHTHSPHPDPL